MTAIARLTRAELRKLATTPAYLITIAITVALAVLKVIADAYNAGKNGAAPLGTDHATYQMLKIGVVCFLATPVLGKEKAQLVVKEVSSLESRESLLPLLSALSVGV